MPITKILQLSDTHIVDEGMVAYGVVDTALHLERAVRYIVDILPKIGPIDGMIITGDLTDHGTQKAYERFQSILSPLKMPIFVLPGNHDHRETLRATLSKHDYLPEEGPLNFRCRIGNLDVLALDSLDEGKSYGRLAPETLKWLSEELDRLKGEPVLIAIHHPPFDCGIAHMDAIKLQDPDAFLSVVSEHQAARLIICGHVHRFIYRQTAPSPMVIAPSPAHSVALDHRPDGASEFFMEPGGFLLHSFDSETASFTSEYVPVGPFEGPHPFFGGE
ncbi:MAG: phosphodiesterase [Pseudomonadota bacterium]